jgi:predicted nucleic acid-binding protein
MNYFFIDASALGKRYVVETGTPLVNQLFNGVPRERMIALLLALGEVVSILVRRKNARQISEKVYRQAMAEFRAEVADSPDFVLHTVSDDLVRTSLPLIEQHSLNATDAIILRCALQIAETLRSTGDDLVLVTSDVRLAASAEATGLAIWNPETDSQAYLDELTTVSP